MLASDNELYVGIATPNLNHDPANDGNPTYWKRQTGLAYETQETANDLKLKTAAFEINNWDMSVPATHTEAVSGMPVATKIISITVMIYNDAQNTVNSLEYTGVGTTPSGYWAYDYNGGSPEVVMLSRTGGAFDNINYNDDTILRGYIHITYYE